MTAKGTKAALEAVLFAAPVPLSVSRLAEILKIDREQVRQALSELQADYGPDRGIHLVEVAGGFQLRTRPEHAAQVSMLSLPRPAGLSRPALETLAIIAYRQPVTRAEIEAIRGVKADSVLETLLSRRLIREAGRREGPGRPVLFCTTREFLLYFGLKDLKELPLPPPADSPDPGQSSQEPAG